jgi:hypothetical protein
VKYDDETLMAYVDGELEPGLRTEIEAAVAGDPALARRIDEQRALRARVAGAFAKVLDQPLPERLEAAARGGAARPGAPGRGNVLQFPARSARAPSPPWRAREWVAMAASLLLGVLLSWRLLVPGSSGVIESGPDGLLARGELARALENQLASEQRGDETVLIGLTFRDRQGGYCRSFVLREAQTAGLACRGGSEWRIPVTDSSALSQGQMQQAGSALPPAILRAIESRMDGAALDAEAEQGARQSGWASSRR